MRGVLGKKLDPERAARRRDLGLEKRLVRGPRDALVILRREPCRDRDRAKGTGGGAVLLDEEPARLFACDGVRVVLARRHEITSVRLPKDGRLESRDDEVRLLLGERLLVCAPPGAQELAARIVDERRRFLEGHGSHRGVAVNEAGEQPPGAPGRRSLRK